MTHSLERAIADGTISEEDAYYGLSFEDLIRLEARYGDATLLVYLRCGSFDECEMMSVKDIIDWHDAPTPRRARGLWWYYENILTVTPLVFDR